MKLTKKDIKNKEIHNKWWGDICKHLMKGLNFEQAKAIVGKPIYNG